MSWKLSMDEMEDELWNNKDVQQLNDKLECKESQ